MPVSLASPEKRIRNFGSKEERRRTYNPTSQHRQSRDPIQDQGDKSLKRGNKQRRETNQRDDDAEPTAKGSVSGCCGDVLVSCLLAAGEIDGDSEDDDCENGLLLVTVRKGLGLGLDGVVPERHGG